MRFCKDCPWTAWTLEWRGGEEINWAFRHDLLRDVIAFMHRIVSVLEISISISITPGSASPLIGCKVFFGY